MCAARCDPSGHAGQVCQDIPDWIWGFGRGCVEAAGVSKARLVVTAIETEGRTVAEVVAAYGVSRSWVYELLGRYRAEGEAAFEPRSRRPRTSPTATPPATVDLIIKVRKQLVESGLDAGPDTIVWHLRHRYEVRVSASTVARTLTRQGLVIPQPNKRPKSSYLRFEAEQPNETWQSDFTHYLLADGTDTETITWLDDHSRYALHVSPHRHITGRIVLDTFTETAAQHGYPASVLTDIQCGWRGIRADLSAGGEDRCRPAPARRRFLTEWSASRLLAC